MEAEGVDYDTITDRITAKNSTRCSKEYIHMDREMPTRH